MDRAVKLTYLFTRQNHNVLIRLRVKYVVCPPNRVVLDLTELFPSTVWLWLPSIAANNTLRRTSHQQCLWADFDRQNHNGLEAFMLSFRVWYVQCFTKRLALNLIEFIQSKVWRSFDSLALLNKVCFLNTPCEFLNTSRCVVVTHLFTVLFHG